MDTVLYNTEEKIRLLRANGYVVREGKVFVVKDRVPTASRSSFAFKAGRKYDIDTVFDSTIKSILLKMNPIGGGEEEEEEEEGGFYTEGVGIDISGAVISLSHLGLEDLTLPGEDKILFYDYSAEAVGWANFAEATSKLKISSNDTTPGYLEDKLSLSYGGNVSEILELSTIGEGADETRILQIDETKISHDNIADVSTDDHHSEVHTLATSGPHTGSLPLTDLVPGTAGDIITRQAADWAVLAKGTQNYVLKMGATYPEWGTVDWSELTGSQPAPIAHNHAWSDITSGVPTTFAGYGISDTLANLNTTLSDATLYKWEVDQGAVNIHGNNVVYGSVASTACVGNDSRLSDDRDPNAHVLVSADHTASVLTVGWVIAADSATTFSWRQLLGSEINNDLGWGTGGGSNVSVANQANDRLITATAVTDALNAEANLTFGGSNLSILNGYLSTKGIHTIAGADEYYGFSRISVSHTSSAIYFQKVGNSSGEDMIARFAYGSEAVNTGTKGVQISSYGIKAYYEGAIKLETTSTGVDITGELNSTGDITSTKNLIQVNSTGVASFAAFAGSSNTAELKLHSGADDFAFNINDVWGYAQFDTSESEFRFTKAISITGTCAATTVTGANVTTGTNPGHVHQRVAIYDCRTMPGTNGQMSYMPNPNDSILNKRISSIFSYTWGGSGWGSVLTLKGWDGNYAVWQIGGNASTSTTDDWYFRTGLNTTWNAWRKIWHSGNSNLSTAAWAASIMTINGILLEDSGDRSGLLEINRKGSTAYAGVEIKFSSTAFWSFMGNQTLCGLYDDYNSGWILQYSENAGVKLHFAGAKKFETTNAGATVSGGLTINAIYNTTLKDGNIIKFDRASANYLWAETAGGYLLLGANAVGLGSANALVKVGTAAVSLRYGSSAPTAVKLETTNTGILITGDCKATNYRSSDNSLGVTTTVQVVGGICNDGGTIKQRKRTITIKDGLITSIGTLGVAQSLPICPI